MKWLESISASIGPKTFRSMFFLTLYVFIFIIVMIISFPKPPSSNVGSTEVTVPAMQVSQANPPLTEEAFILSQHRHSTSYVATEIIRYTGVLTREVRPISISPTPVSPVENILNHAVNLSGTHEAHGISSKNGDVIFTGAP